MLVFATKIAVAVALAGIERNLCGSHNVVFAIFQDVAQFGIALLVGLFANVCETHEQLKTYGINRFYHSEFAYGAQRTMTVYVFGQLFCLRSVQKHQAFNVVGSGAIQIDGRVFKFAHLVVQFLKVARFHIVNVVQLVEILLPCGARHGLFVISLG